MEKMDLNWNEWRGLEKPCKGFKFSKVLFWCGVRGSNKPFYKFKWNWKCDKLNSVLCWNNQNLWTTLIFTEGDWVSAVAFLQWALIDVCCHLYLSSTVYMQFWNPSFCNGMSSSSETPVRVPIMTSYIQQLFVSHRTQRAMINHSKGALKLCNSKSWEGKKYLMIWRASLKFPAIWHQPSDDLLGAHQGSITNSTALLGSSCSQHRQCQ